MQHLLTTLDSDELSVGVCTTLGAEIREIRYKEFSENILFSTPWQDSTSDFCSCSETSEAHFISHYSGGWQLMLPNMGYPSLNSADPLGYHGEAWALSWETIERTNSSIKLRALLSTRPIEVIRVITVAGDELQVSDTVTNTSSSAIEFSWGHHPAFSQAIFDQTSEVLIAGREIRVEVNTLSDSLSDVLPDFIRQDETGVHLHGLTSIPYSFLAYISDFISPYARIINKTHELTLELRWSLDLFPHLWLWIENQKISSEPWNSQVRTLALEPTSTIPNLGFEYAKKHGNDFVTLEANQSKVGQVTLKVFKSSRDVSL
jgi:galactose mutarotase-like enzyme